MMRLVPPSGTPVTVENLANIVLSLLHAKEDKLSQLIERVKTYFNTKYCFAANSGRAALTIVLKSLSQIADSNKNEVIIPGYTCYSVAASIQRAGLKIKPCDVDMTSLDFKYDQLEKTDFRTVLAIIPSNLFGIPNNLHKILQIAKKNQVFVVDDACQSMGAKILGQYVGKWGIAGIFSFDRGKNITAMGGGMIITDDPLLAEAITNHMQSCSNSAFTKNIEAFLKLIVYSIFLHPGLYQILHRIPFLKLGLTFFDANFPIESFNQMKAAIALEMFNKLNQINKIRREKALYLLANLARSEKIFATKPYPDSFPVYLRLPLILQTREIRDCLIHKFLKAGIAATGLYPSAIHQIEEIQHHIVFSERALANAEKLAQTILTLPTHPYVSHRDLDKMLYILNNIEKI